MPAQVGAGEHDIEIAILVIIAPGHGRLTQADQPGIKNRKVTSAIVAIDTGEGTATTLTGQKQIQIAIQVKVTPIRRARPNGGKIGAIRQEAFHTAFQLIAGCKLPLVRG